LFVVGMGKICPIHLGTQIVKSLCTSRNYATW
jgi:hypothetical protein